MGREKERIALKRLYRSRRWAQKINEMSDARVMVVFQRLKKQGVIGR